MSPPETDIDTPGIDVVLTAADPATQRELLEPRARTILGALHRRFWNRRREMLQRHAQAGGATDSRPVDESSWTVDDYEAPSELRGGPDFCRDAGNSWDARIDGLLTIRSADSSSSGRSVDVIRTRGWDDTESALLVDGRAIPGGVFDLGMTMWLRADELRDGHTSIWLCLPAVHCPVEARLWNDLLNVAQDRMGIVRGTVRTIVSVESPDAARSLDAILWELRSHAVGVCFADGRGIDDVEIKDAAARRGAMFVGAVAASTDADTFA